MLSPMATVGGSIFSAITIGKPLSESPKTTPPAQPAEQNDDIAVEVDRPAAKVELHTDKEGTSPGPITGIDVVTPSDAAQAALPATEPASELGEVGPAYVIDVDFSAAGGPDLSSGEPTELLSPVPEVIPDPSVAVPAGPVVYPLPPIDAQGAGEVVSLTPVRIGGNLHLPTLPGLSVRPGPAPAAAAPPAGIESAEITEVGIPAPAEPVEADQPEPGQEASPAADDVDQGTVEAPPGGNAQPALPSPLDNLVAEAVGTPTGEEAPVAEAPPSAQVSEAAHASTVEKPVEAYRHISREEARSLLETNPDVFLLDVRTPGEYREGHIPGATLIPVSELSERLSEVPSGTEPKVVYCRSGGRSARASHILEEAGFVHLLDLEGGFLDWNGPTE